MSQRLHGRPLVSSGIAAAPPHMLGPGLARARPCRVPSARGLFIPQQRFARSRDPAQVCRDNVHRIPPVTRLEASINPLIYRQQYRSQRDPSTVCRCTGRAAVSVARPTLQRILPEVGTFLPVRYRNGGEFIYYDRIWFRQLPAVGPVTEAGRLTPTAGSVGPTHSHGNQKICGIIQA